MKIVGICGSLRKASFNKSLLVKFNEHVSKNHKAVQFEILSLDGIPLFNQDIEKSNNGGPPSAVVDFKKKIAEADGILFASSEYNFSISGVLKNAIDWASREANAFDDKPAAIVGAGGGTGAAKSQMALRQTAVFLNLHIMNKPQVQIPAFSPGTFNMETGELVDAKWIERIGDFADKYIAWLEGEGDDKKERMSGAISFIKYSQDCGCVVFVQRDVVSVCDITTQGDKCEFRTKLDLNNLGSSSSPSSAPVIGCNFSPEGKYFVCVTDAKDIAVFQTSDWSLVAATVSPKRATAVQFLPGANSAEVVVCDKAGGVYGWEFLVKEAEPHLKMGHLSMLLDLIFIKKTQHVITADRDEKIRVSLYPKFYNIVSFCLGHREFVGRLVEGEVNGTPVLFSGSGDGTVRVWNFMEGKELECIDVCTRNDIPVRSVSALTFHQKSNSVVFGFENDNKLYVYRINNELKAKFVEEIVLEHPVWTISMVGENELVCSVVSAKTPIIALNYCKSSDKFEIIGADEKRNVVGKAAASLCKNTDTAPEYLGLESIRKGPGFNGVSQYQQTKQKRIEENEEKKRKKLQNQ
eukprot:Nk52_evm19s240 gene=Nk52_evmTU19s240